MDRNSGSSDPFFHHPISQLCVCLFLFCCVSLGISVFKFFFCTAIIYLLKSTNSFQTTCLSMEKKGWKFATREAEMHYDRCVEMLVAAGYFRARIATLSPFDKLIGGMAWCLTGSTIEVEVDVSFQEESSMGQKM
jgi:hypothetical protein